MLSGTESGFIVSHWDKCVYLDNRGAQIRTRVDLHRGERFGVA